MCPSKTSKLLLVVTTYQDNAKGDVGNAIVNTWSKTASSIFLASNEPTGVFLLP